MRREKKCLAASAVLRAGLSASADAVVFTALGPILRGFRMIGSDSGLDVKDGSWAGVSVA